MVFITGVTCERNASIVARAFKESARKELTEMPWLDNDEDHSPERVSQLLWHTEFVLLLGMLAFIEPVLIRSFASCTSGVNRHVSFTGPIID